MGKLERSWALFKASLFVMGRHKQLLVFPIVVFVLTLGILLFFLSPVALRPTGYSYLSTAHWEAIGQSLFKHTSDAHGQSASTTLTPIALAYLAVMYFVSMFFATFFNVAFYHEIMMALGGQEVSLSRGLRFALTRWKAVLMWTLFAGIVGMIIKQIEERLGVVGQIVARFIGLAWSIAAVFVIPLIVQDEKSINPFQMLKNSASILKRTWGEALIGYVGMGILNTLVTIGSLVFVVGALMVSIAINNYWLLVIVTPLWLLGIFAWYYLMNVAGQIYKAALYLYAADGIVSAPYSADLLNSAWKFKKQ